MRVVVILAVVETANVASAVRGRVVSERRRRRRHQSAVIRPRNGRRPLQGKGAVPQ